MERRHVPARMIEIISPAGFENFYDSPSWSRRGRPTSPKWVPWPRTTALSSANRLASRHHVSVSPHATPVLVVRALALEQSIFSTPVPTRARHGAALDDSSWRQEQAAQSRQRIIQAGRDLFVNRGYGRTTIAEIASAATI